MEDDGVGAAAAGMNEGPTKRTRRPSVRLHEPYYEYLLGHRKPQRQWKPTQRQSDGAKKPPTVKTAHAKNKKNDDVSDANKGENAHDFSFDDDGVAIGNWKNFNGSNRNRDFKRKRVRPSGSNKRSAPAKSRQNENKEIREFSSSISGGKQEEEKGDNDDDGINSNLVVENADPSSRNCLISHDDGDDNNNVDRNQGMEQKGLCPNKSEGDVSTRGGVDKKNKHGVRAWLKKLGLQKYAPVFEVHEVDDVVLEKLTLDDLKDMGINAVGSRRKMYASIQKLGKALS